MYSKMDQWIEIRQRVLREEVSKRQILRETGMHWKTLEKILSNASPPGYRRTKPACKGKIGPYLGRIREILNQDKDAPKKQRHTAKLIWGRLRLEGFDGGYTAVRAKRIWHPHLVLPPACRGRMYASLVSTDW